MKFLLINTNQIVQKLVEITAKKAGASLTTITESSQLANLEQYDYILIDDDCLRLDSQAYTEALKDKRKCLIYNKQGTRIEGFDDYVQKPFLPTSILDIFTAQLSKQAPAQNPEKTPLDSVDSALGAEFDAALSSESLDNTENAPIELDNLSEGLKEIDNLLDDSLENAESSLEDSNDMDSSDVIKQESIETESEDSQAKNIETEEPTLDIEQAIDELNPEVALDEGLDIDLDLSNLDELDDFSDDENANNTEESADSQEAEEKAEVTNDVGDMADLDEQALGDLNELGELDLGDLTQDESLTDSTSDTTSSQAEAESQVTGDLDEQTLDDLENLDDLDNEMANLDSTQENIEQETPEIAEAQESESSQNKLDELGDLDALEDINEIAETKEPQSVDDVANNDDLVEQSLQDDEMADLGDLGSLEELDDVEQDANLDSTAQSPQDTDETSIDSTDSIENLDLESLGEENLEADITESLSDLGDEALELDSLDDSSEAGQDIAQEATDTHIPLDEEFSSEGLLENDLLDDVEKLTLDEPVLDKEQVSEVSKALQAIDEESADFISLKEPQIAQALGEELPEELLSLDESSDELPDASLDLQDTMESAPAQSSQGQSSQPQEIVKNMIANSVQSSISSLSSNNLKSMLDGLEVTINISFKDKSK